LEVKLKSALAGFATFALVALIPACTPFVKDQSGSSQSRPGSRFRDRNEFVKLLSSIKAGMSDTEVIRILGKPNDVRTTDEMQVHVGNSTEAWCFGADGHLGFPTLGTIWFLSVPGRKTVLEITGAKGTPPPPSLFDEGELRRLLSMLGHDGRRGLPEVLGHPAWRIKEVNTLAPLGKTKALAAVEEYVRVCPYLFSDYEMSNLLRVLFDVPNDTGYMPDSTFLVVTPRPTDRKRIPRYPMLILGDVPLQIAFSGFSVGNYIPDFAKDVAWFRDHATIRAKPLQPTDKPLQLLSEWKAYGWFYRDFKKSESWQYEGIDLGVKRQLCYLVRTIYRGDIEKGTLSEPVRWDMNLHLPRRKDFAWQFGDRAADDGVEVRCSE
jgi:hypothetical protein